MAKLRVVIDVNDTGECVAEMTFRTQELEATGNSPSEALQNLAETLSLYEQDESEISEDFAASRTYQYMS